MRACAGCSTAEFIERERAALAIPAKFDANFFSSGNVRTDMCVTMCLDICVDISVDMCVGMYVDMCVGMCVGMCVNMVTTFR